MTQIARALSPVMRRLFPDVPAEHPAMGAMILNLSANVLGLGNAATPFGLKAMRELETLNPRPGVATNAMALFLAINTSGVAVLPLGVIAIRASLGSTNAAGIVVPTLLATAVLDGGGGGGRQAPAGPRALLGGARRGASCPTARRREPVAARPGTSNEAEQIAALELRVRSAAPPGSSAGSRALLAFALVRQLGVGARRRGRLRRA